MLQRGTSHAPAHLIFSAQVSALGRGVHAGLEAAAASQGSAEQSSVSSQGPLAFPWPLLSYRRSPCASPSGKHACMQSWVPGNSLPGANRGRKLQAAASGCVWMPQKWPLPWRERGDVPARGAQQEGQWRDADGVPDSTGQGRLSISLLRRVMPPATAASPGRLLLQTSHAETNMTRHANTHHSAEGPGPQIPVTQTRGSEEAPTAPPAVGLPWSRWQGRG